MVIHLLNLVLQEQIEEVILYSSRQASGFMKIVLWEIFPFVKLRKHC